MELLRKGCCSSLHLIFFATIYTSICQVSAERGTIIPLYVYPKTDSGVDTWKPLKDAFQANPIEVWAIVNVNSGPGSSIDENYSTAIRQLKDIGINTLGYVKTNYTRQSISAVEAEITSWKSWYSPTGIFFDEMTNDNNAAHIEYYTRLDGIAKGQGFTFTVGNPGTDAPLGYFNAVDTVMIYESPGFPARKAICTRKYKQLPGVEAIGIFPYDVPTLNETLVLKAKECVGYIYATNDNGSNPWDTLPSYLSRLFELLAR